MSVAYCLLGGDFRPLPTLFSHCFCFLDSLVLFPLVSEITPLKVDQFAWELRHHPNWPQCNFVLDGLQNGFKLGFHPQLLLKSATKNKPSAYQQPMVSDDYLAHEVSRGKVAGPFSSPPLFNLHISSFGVISIKGQPRKWCLIVDLSSPGSASVNDGIDSHKFTLHYSCGYDQVDPGALLSGFGFTPLSQ